MSYREFSSGVKVLNKTVHADLPFIKYHTRRRGYFTCRRQRIFIAFFNPFIRNRTRAFIRIILNHRNIFIYSFKFHISFYMNPITGCVFICLGSGISNSHLPMLKALPVRSFKLRMRYFKPGILRHLFALHSAGTTIFIEFNIELC